MQIASVVFPIACLLFTAISCTSDSIDADTVNVVDGTDLPSDKTEWWKPAIGTSFDWDLNDLTDHDHSETDVVDVDAFTTTKEQVAALHAEGKKVIAYLSVGTFEKDRPDGHLLPKEVSGQAGP